MLDMLEIIYLSLVSHPEDLTIVGMVQETDSGEWKLDIKAQTRAVIENIREILVAAGGDLCNLVDVTVFLVDMSDYSAMNEIYNEFFQAQTGPARTTVAVKQLPNPRLLIEIKSVAYLRK